MNISLEKIALATDGTLIGDVCEITSITTDSRDVRSGGLFVALSGERFDGNDFATAYLEAGGQAAVVSREIDVPKGKSAVLVKDTKLALLKIAKYYRSTFPIPVVGITGSVGKTSTKEMVASVLDTQYNVLKTDKNFNNEIGAPLTIFRLNGEHTVAVCEMGMNNFGEISRISDAVMPNIAIITNIGTAHIGNLGSQENILKAKLEVCENLADDGCLILNGDDKLLWGIKDTNPCKKIYYGIENKEADVVAENIVLNTEYSTFSYKGMEFTVPIAGVHHIYNALSAISAGEILGISPDKMTEGVKKITLPEMRQKTTQIGENIIIEDCYNASCDSCKASLKVLSGYKEKGRTVAVLGDMLEQGNFAEKLHREVGAYVSECKIDMLVTVGELSRYTADEARKNGTLTESFSNTEDASKFLIDALEKTDIVLFKASRGMKLERASETLLEHLKNK